MHDIFLSYSRTDNEIMQKVKQSFKNAGFTVWTDEGIQPGTPDWEDAIEKAIQDTKTLVCILSPDARKSRWVRAELQRAEWYKKQVYLILARGEEVQSIPMGYERHQWIDIRINNQYYEELKKLINTIQRFSKSVTSSYQAPSKKNRSSPLHKGINEHPMLKSNYFYSDVKDVYSSFLRATTSLLPQPFDWCQIPAGKVTLEKGGYVPHGGKTYNVNTFYISKYPITNIQYYQFLADKGYQQPSYWSDEGWQYIQKHHISQPSMWDLPDWNRDDFPVVGVSFYEALAFCNWLNDILTTPERYYKRYEVKISLPTEQEWQRAAQGNDNRIYPWGNEYDQVAANFAEGKPKLPSHVQRYTQGQSPYGVFDMCGNTLEWCSTNYDSGENNLDSATGKLVRGAAWNCFNENFARVAYRQSRFPDDFNSQITGFRICARIIDNSN